MNHEDQVERLKKVYALALKGSDGEKDAAAALLDKLLKKYNISEADLSDVNVQDFHVEYHGKEQLKLLVQVVYKVTNNDSCITPLYSKSRRRCQTKVNVECTKAQIVDIRLLFDFYTHLFNEEKDMFLTAFVHKHQLYGQPKPGDEKRQYSVDDLIKIRRFMDGMQDATPNKRIERS